MRLFFDNDDLQNRRKTLLKDTEGKVLYYGLYDFSYKYRTNIYDADGEPIGYVQADPGKERPEVCLNGPGYSDVMVFEGRDLRLLKEDLLINCQEDAWICDRFMIGKSFLEVRDDSVLSGLLVLFGSIEIQRS